MSNIRREFYDAINKANVQKPKKNIKKFLLKEEFNLESQIANILETSDSAVLDCQVVINNQSLIDYLYEITKKDEETLELEKIINHELEILNKLRDEARRKYRELNKMNEFTSFTPSAAASSAAAGAGAGGRIYITIDNTTNSYVVDGYVEDYLV
jgi:hypothetical protein